jgi:hypothetical protein
VSSEVIRTGLYIVLKYVQSTHNWYSSFHIGFNVSGLTEVLQRTASLEFKYRVQNG